MLNKTLAAILLVFAAALLLLNIYGLTLGQYPQPPKSEWDMGPSDRVLASLSVSQLYRQRDEQDEAYFQRITRQVDQYLLHGYNIPIKPWDNYLLWLHDQLRSEVNYFDETINPARALKQGIGQCSQFSLILVSVLVDQGYDARVVRLNGHVVATARSRQGTWQILDANYGVVIPHELRYVEQNPQILAPIYGPIYRQIPEGVQLPMEQLYSSAENNRIFTLKQQRGAKAYYFESLAEYLIWVLPLLAIGLARVLWRKSSQPPLPE